MVPGGYGIGVNAAVITTSCPQDKLELVMRALDYAYSEAGNLYWNFGKQGVSWEYDANGQPAYLPLVTNDPDGLNNAIDKFGGSTWSGNCIQATLLLYLKNTQQAIDANDLWFYPNEAVSAKWTVPPGVTLTPDESSRAAELQNTISTYSNEMAIKFITGQEPFNNFDTFVARINQMGLPELLSINQTGYDRYLAR
jgi:putative aldouronate transport system substrate-binding protein